MGFRVQLLWPLGIMGAGLIKYGNSNISLCKNIIFKKYSRRNKILQDIITL
jgi:hypothetical protein